MQLRVPARRSPGKGRSLTRPSRRSGAFDRRLRLEPLEARCLLDGTISGYVRQDVDGDGILEPSDQGVAGFRVYLDANRDGQLQEGTEQWTETNAAGQYIFSNVPPGDYDIAVADRVGWDQTSPTTRLIGLECDRYDLTDAYLWEIDPETGFAIHRIHVNYDRGEIYGHTEDNFYGLSADPYRPGVLYTMLTDYTDHGLAWSVEVKPTELHYLPDAGEVSVHKLDNSGLDWTDCGGVAFDATTSQLYGGPSYNEANGIPDLDYRLWRYSLAADHTTTIGTVVENGFLHSFGEMAFDSDWNLWQLETYAGPTANFYRYDKTTGETLEKIRPDIGTGWPLEYNWQRDDFWTTAEGRLAHLDVNTGHVTVYGYTLPSIVAFAEVPGFSDRPVRIESSETVTDLDFGFVFHDASISGTVFQDLWGNGERDIADRYGVAGRTVFLDENLNGIPDAGETQTTTDEFGHYSFPNLSAGSYYVAVERRLGWETTYPHGATGDQHFFNLIPGQMVEADFGVAAPVDIEGRAFVDTDADGIPDDEEFETDYLVRVNFQPADSDVPETYVADTGELFGDRGNGFSYGWSTAVREYENDLHPDPRYDTGVSLPEPGEGDWEIALPNGTYNVFAAFGSPVDGGQIHNIDIEGTVLTDPDGADLFDVYTVTVAVTDGRLTIQTAPDAYRAKIAFVDISEALEPVTIYVDQNRNGVRDQFSSSFGYGPDVMIPDGGSVSLHLDVLDVEGPICDVDVGLRIEHPYDADLDVYLRSPRGTRVKLFTDVGGSGDDFYYTYLSDEAAISITDAVAPFAGPPFGPALRPEGSLWEFDGEDPQGTWTLEITDDTAGNSGVITQWGLTIKTGDFVTQTDAWGNYSFKNLPPGLQSVRQELPHTESNTYPGTEGSTVVESFEEPGNYIAVEADPSERSEAAARHGEYGLAPDGWIYGGPGAPVVEQGDTIRAWFQPVDGWGRVYLGFGASEDKALWVIAGGNDLALAYSPTQSFYDLASVEQSYVTSAWYELEATWGAEGTLTGRVYDQFGELLNTVVAPMPAWEWADTGTLAFRATGEYSLDTVRVYRDGAHEVLVPYGTAYEVDSAAPPTARSRATTS